MAVKLIAIDLDETLLRSDKSVCPKGAAAIREAIGKGIHVVLASSRQFASMQQISAEIGMQNQAMICADGALIMSHAESEIWQSLTISREIALSIAQFADANNWELTVVAGEKTYYQQREGQSLGYLKDYRYIVESNLTMMQEAEPMRILVYEDAPISGMTTFLEAQGYLSRLTVQYYYRPDDTIRSMGIFPQDANKGKALSHVCERLGIPLEETLAIGDGSNDIPMFEVAGKCVVMGNARDAVKQYADFVCASHDEGGVAEAIEKYVLI
jgi:Cof subfamily protein (haloacid dehalogenase superfamily)